MRFLRCTWCTTPLFRPHLLCPTCGGTRLSSLESRGEGRIHSWMKVTSKGHPVRHVAVVELDEGFRMNCRLADALPGSAPVGTRVSLAQDAGDGDGVPVFQVAEVGTHAARIASVLRTVRS